MSSTQRKMVTALALAAPFILFVALLVLSPATAGTFAGSLLGRITDPPVLIGLVLSALAGVAGWRWWWAFGIGTIVGSAGCVLGYSWWQQVAGSAIANRTAASFVVWSIVFACYGFTAGRMFLRTPAKS